MHAVGMKNWIHHMHMPHMHMPHRHDMALRVSHMFHDERFWAIFALVALTALIVGFGIWAAMTQGPAEEPFLRTPFSPYLY